MTEGCPHCASGKTQPFKDMQLLTFSGFWDSKPSSLLSHTVSLNADTNNLLGAHFLAQLLIEMCMPLLGRR